MHIRGNEVRYGLSIGALYHALNVAFNKVQVYDGCVGFRLHRNEFPLEPWFPFAMRQGIWEACCGNAGRMFMYLQIVLPISED